VTADHRAALRSLPGVDALLTSGEGRSLLRDVPRDLAVEALRTTLAEARSAIQAGDALPSDDHLLHRARKLVDDMLTPSLRPVINATGVIIHTNLGRAPLSPSAFAAMERVSRGYSSLEFDLVAGQRGSRHEHVTALLQRLTGAEAALVVNNNASAVLLALASLATGREVVISRGQLVEIGGGFRIPDVLRQSGARLVEVGTTNRTYVEDYEAAITPDTAVLLRVHASNFRVVGFVHSATLEELVELASSRGVQVVDDLGSGSLIPTERYGLLHEPTVQESVAAGTDVVCFSGDKLLGGPQAGILVGSAATIGRLRRHPLTRAVRPDKATIAGLAATLTHYLHGEAEREVPVWRMISTSLAELEERGQHIAGDLLDRGLAIVPSAAAIGGGAVPGDTLPSRAIAVRADGVGAQELAARMRAGDPPVVGHIQEDRLLLDLRTILPSEDEDVARALAAALRA
jgi:L-seryl-tRNA(Ser) seleniumtransferase